MHAARLCTAPAMSRARRAEVPVLLCIEGGCWGGRWGVGGFSRVALHPALFTNVHGWETRMSETSDRHPLVLWGNTSCRADESASGCLVQRAAICCLLHIMMDGAHPPSPPPHQAPACLFIDWFLLVCFVVTPQTQRLIYSGLLQFTLCRAPDSIKCCVNMGVCVHLQHCHVIC